MKRKLPVQTTVTVDVPEDLDDPFERALVLKALTKTLRGAEITFYTASGTRTAIFSGPITEVSR